MKIHALFFLAAAGLAISMMACSPQQSTSSLTAAIDSIKVHYAPDRRVAVFDVSAMVKGSVLIAKGEVDNPKAKEDVLATIHSSFGGQVIDSVKVLPDPQLGDRQFGIVAASVANVRTNPRHSAEMATQAMMGMVTKLLKKQGGWYYVQLPDNYLGWLEEAAMKVTDAAGVEAWKAAPKVIATTYFTMIREKASTSAEPVRDAVAGALMKETGSSGGWVAVELPDGCKGFIEKACVDEYAHWKKTRRLTAENIEKTAKTFLGVPYLWGGTSPKGMDCSGFTKTVYRLNGLELSRDADQQAYASEEVNPGENFENLKKGDLLFFGRKATAERPERITHVGIYLQNREFIHTPGGSWVKYNSFDPSAPNYSEGLRKSFVRAGRYIGTAKVPEVAGN